VTARSRERGSHAGRPRNYGLPFTVPGLSGLGTPGSFRHGWRSASANGRAPAPAPASAPTDPSAPWPGAAGPGNVLPQPPGPPGLPGQPGPPAPQAGGGPLPNGAPHQGGGAHPGDAPRPGGAGRGRGSRHRKPAERRALLSKKARLGVALVVVLGVFALGFADGFGGEGAPTPTVASFLLDWQTGHYTEAAALTNGGTKPVSAQLAAAYTDLDATNSILSMTGVSQHGDTAVATYQATVDLAQAGQVWSYTGKFGLTSKNGQWTVDWAPSVINPHLGPGERLAVVSTYAPRAGVLDMDGQPLVTLSADYRVGVYPGKLKHPAATAATFSQVTGLDEQQVLGQIESAPPSDFLPLLTLDPAGFGSLRSKLGKVAGLTYQKQNQRLFESSAQEVVGEVGTENSSVLRAEGAAYQPGTTVGMSGFEQAYQDDLIGTPTTSVVLGNAAGHSMATLWSSPGGHAGTPVRTTLNSQEQSAAANVLAGAGNSAEIVALDWSSGQVRVVASHEADNVPLPAHGALDARVEPGMAFSIVSAAALLSTGVAANHPLPCEPVADVGGVTFTYTPATTSTATLASDFADGCGTAFANMSRTLTPQQLASAERAFGIGASWQLQLQLPAFSGSAPTVSGEADVAAQATGTGGVLMSPLAMATVAAEVAAGAGRSPVLLPTATPANWQAPLSGTSLDELRQLMRLAVTSGSAEAANLPGAPVYGQAGVVPSGKHSYLSWFVGYRGSLAVAVLETGATASQAAAALAGSFLKAVG
jgi:cell division protein FtsI/penicillin-binding protein 2